MSFVTFAQAVVPDALFRWARDLPLDVRRFDTRVLDLPDALDGLLIAQVSDFHVGSGPLWHPQRLDEVARCVAEERPDLIINTGDFLADVAPLEWVGGAVARVQVPDSRVVGVPGNHDYVAGPEVMAGLRSTLAAAGMDVLENRGTCLTRNGAGISVFGLTADMAGWEDAVDWLLRSDRPRLVLIHEPDLAERLPPGCADLVLAGHTHGGQIAVPGLKGPIVRRMCGSRYVEGMYEINGNPVYINRGLGCVGLPLRVWANPELTFIRLVR
ncbi:MAG TPA: metallophosphoesterase [Chloroflexota bacterium]|nr:metallophosphoesterase [Chloroflexota bacterium]